jgi:hypothetical protein
MDVVYDLGLLYDSGVHYADTPAPQTTPKKRMAKPKLNLDQLTYEQKLTQANEIKTKLTGNANFTTTTPTLAAYAVLITTATTKHAEWTDAQQLGKTKTTERLAAFDALDAATTQLAGYVEAASGGDAAKIESAGMSVRAPKTPPSVPAQVLNLALTAGDFPGTLDVAFDPQAGAKSYEAQTSADPMSDTSWAFKMSLAKSSGTIPGLTSGSKVWARTRAVGAAGVGPWSDPAVKVVP